MKKGLSVLLIVAALFGFYGGASSLTDVLACKDYWEKEGEKSTADMNKLEDGLNQLGENEQAYLDGVQKLAENEPKLEEGKQTLAEKEAEFAAAPAKLRAGEAKLAAGKAAYKDGQAQYAAGKKQYAESKEKQEMLRSNIALLEAGFKKWDGLFTTIQDYKAVDEFKPYFAEDGSAISPPDSVMMQKALPFLALLTPSEQASIASDYSNLEDVAKTAGARYTKEATENLKNAIGLAMKSGQQAAVITDEKGNPVDLDTTKLSDENPATETIKGFYSNYQTAATNGSKLMPNLMAFVPYVQIKSVADGKQTLIKNINLLAAELKKNADAVKALGGEKAVEKILLVINKGSDSAFDLTVKGLLKKANELIKSNDAALAAAAKQLKDAEKKLAAGARDIKKGEKDLAQGYADYEAAPAKLAAGRQQLADGLKQLEEGKKQLAQYEDGEQQVRDGLATLMSTEPNGGLESILDRRGGDDEFDDANGHLDVQEGLDAVKVGRGYQADSGELITKEITNRAVGTAAGLGAAVLACLAALLSLIKKYKGAAVTAVLAAIAGVAGAVVGNGAGSEFSNIAGSTVGSLPWIAAGVVAAVACVFAIVNFTAKAE